MYRHSLRLLLLIIWLCYDAIYCYVVYAYFTSLPASNQFLVYCRVLFSYVYIISLASRLVLDTCALLCWGEEAHIFDWLSIEGIQTVSAKVCIG